MSIDSTDPLPNEIRVQALDKANNLEHIYGVEINGVKRSKGRVILGLINMARNSLGGGTHRATIYGVENRQRTITDVDKLEFQGGNKVTGSNDHEDFKNQKLIYKELKDKPEEGDSDYEAPPEASSPSSSSSSATDDNKNVAGTGQSEAQGGSNVLESTSNTVQEPIQPAQPAAQQTLAKRRVKRPVPWYWQAYYNVRNRVVRLFGKSRGSDNCESGSRSFFLCWLVLKKK